jgi:hypothetical protein
MDKESIEQQVSQHGGLNLCGALSGALRATVMVRQPGIVRTTLTNVETNLFY